MSTSPQTLTDEQLPNEAANDIPFADDLGAVGGEEESLGDWNEQLDEKFQDTLKKLAQHFCDEFRYARRLEVMTAWKARGFWRELQHMTWNWDNQAWECLGGPQQSKNGTGPTSEDSAVMYSTNIYQGFGDSFIAVLTQNVPLVRFEPDDADEAADIETAKAADSMKRLVQHENDPVKLMTRAAYIAWTDGRMHGWTTWAEDKRTGKPRETQVIEGSLEVKVPCIADRQEDFLYLQYSKEYHVAQVRSKVRARAFDEGYYKKIKGGSTGNGQDTYERIARISIKQGISLRSAGGDAFAHLVTTQRTWCRREAFLCDCVPEEQRDDLLSLFRSGCYMEFDNGIYTGSRDASMDDEWTVENIMEGDGQFRNGKGTCLISVQERFNDIINAAQDVYEKTLPAAFFDDKMFDLDAMREQYSGPGQRHGLDLKDMQVGDTISAHVFFEPAAQVSADMLQYAKELMTDVPEFLTGISAILFGSDTSGDKSGKALSIQQSAAMGRIGLPWRIMKRFYAKMMEQAIRCASRNRKEDAKQGIPDQKGNVETIQVRIEELSGTVRCFPQDDEGLPQSMAERRATYMQLLTESAQDPTMHATLALPKNQEYGKKMIGLELEIAGAESWNKQMVEINQLLEEPPQIVQPPPQQVPNPMMPEVMETINQPPTMQASVPIDAEWDDNAAEFLTVKLWINSSDGQKAKRENPAGFQNVQLHGELHKQALQQQAQAAAPPPQAPAPPAPHIHIHAAGAPGGGGAPAAQPPGVAA